MSTPPPTGVIALHDEQLTRRMFKAHTGLRVSLVVYGAVFGSIAIFNGDEAAPIIVLLAAMAVWSAVTAWWYLSGSRRWPMVVADVAATVITLLAIGATAMVTPIFGAIPVAWAAAAPLAAAICGGPVPGGIAALVVGAAAILPLPLQNASSWTMPVSVLLASVGLGYMIQQVRDSVAQRDRIAASATALAERERLARVIHDGVLQVLALVEREAGSLGPRGGPLAKAAREQEHALRALLQNKSAAWDAPEQAEMQDLATLLDRHAGERVTVSAMADTILIPNATAAEIDAVVTEVLTNVTKHAGASAQAWILLEQVGTEIIVSIRDNGVGAEPATIAQAAHSGHFGVQASIKGRVADLGGVARLRTAPGRGLEWEVRIPVEK